MLNDLTQFTVLMTTQVRVNVQCLG